MSVAFDGFNRNTATFKITEDIEAGTAVKITESAQVEPCADGDAFCGFVENGDIKVGDICTLTVEKKARLATEEMYKIAKGTRVKRV